MPTQDIELGDRVKDKISGIQGIVVCLTYYLYGCTRVGIAPEEGKEGKPAESFFIDEPQCELKEKKVLVSFNDQEKVTAGPSGPYPNPKRNADPR